MLSRSSVRIWSRIHTWTSVISTVFLLMLCITGLPLIFNHELNHALYDEVEPAALPADTAPANLDRIVENGLARNPGHAVQFMFWDRDEPELIWLSIGKAVDSNPDQNRLLKLDSRTGEFLEEVDFRNRLTYVIYRLHVDMYAGLPGKLFLGLMGLLFCVAIVSGVVLYWPSTRKLDFGAMRRDRPRLVRWLDLHNLLGIVTVVWALTVGFTGVINTWADLIFKLWQNDQLVAMTQAYRDRSTPQGPTSVDAAVSAAREAMPGMQPSFVAFPGNPFSSKSHYAVFMRGDTPLTSRLLRPVLIDAETGTLTDSREMPLYAKALLISQPLHFGDYGGMPLKILWALLTVATIVVLITGLYLWVARTRRKRAAKAAIRVAYAAAQH
ncbi:PepSY-associated TM helix domain-containing protein [Pseudorhodoplanes sp.]|uniref:PepSY-associated TM helix domain-containing protein n=1 Tax=Pseudorhodoplanes sp. TaxID=1934341 RepID=UPI00391B52C7